MKVKGTRTLVEEVNITPGDALDALRMELYQFLGLRKGIYFNEKGQAVIDVERHGHNSYFETEVYIDKPSKLQTEIVRAFDLIESTLVSQLRSQSEGKTKWPR